MIEFYLITFQNTSSAIKAEAYLKEKGHSLMIMPTPTFITKSCGISIRVQADSAEKIKNILVNGEIAYKAYYKKEDNNYIQVL
ncbi:DUF3343 domain-containing protein [Clostridium thermarum]|uniref:DUF3343 domain-containing protein n=1 Tax=Clostridium thermarum TaxID=1716543 RepID=UPI001FAAB932|nr:DUF3343 domain-containing protein [Clostridium thermarum]